MPKKKTIEPEADFIIFKCPNCETRLQIPIPDLQAGIVISCEECDEDIVETISIG